ncbi:MAG: UvrD-helicase domain-containing protein [Planctomycetes bacterium]|nr:UvrD-helicase domain-containing protein [Planctomycetota bacterium]
MGKSRQRILANLTDPQREAVSYGGGPLLVVAGAGTGKTRVITHRIAYLLAEGVAPDRLIAMTFTNKAAEEMRRRVEAMVGEQVYVTTFHSFCARFLRRHIHVIGLDPSFSIYDRTDSQRLIRRIIKARQIDRETFRPGEVLAEISANKDRVIGPDKYAEQAVGIEEQTVALVYRDYEEELAANNGLDFDDLLLKPLEVFRERPDVLRDYQELYLHVLVDEYQDTNLPQHLMARALQGKHRNITAVGDPDQVIYTWRGARLANLLEFEEDFPGAHIVKLERNYRSSANILQAASACIRHNQLRREKALWTEDESGPLVEVVRCADPYDEGRTVAQTASELISNGVLPWQIAVFYRTKRQALPLEDAFTALSVPHQVVDSVGFFERKATKDLRAYLQLMLNPRDDVACRRIINCPCRGIGVKTLQALQEEADRLGLSLVEAAGRAQELSSLSIRARGAVERFWNLCQRLRSLPRDSVEELIDKLLDITDYVAAQPDSRREDLPETVEMLLDYARQYDSEGPERDLLGFIERTALVSDVDGWDERAGAVSLMTLHSAKGLEFDAVFIVGAQEDILPHRRALEEADHGAEQMALEEERRLFYVGMTRARKHLFISYAERHTAQGRREYANPSRFLDELSEEAVARRAGAQGDGKRIALARQIEDPLKRKGPCLSILSVPRGKKRLTKGARVQHASYGVGQVLQVDWLGTQNRVKIDFEEQGAVTLLVTADDVAGG